MVDTKKLRIKAVADGMIPSVELVLAKPLAWLAHQGLVEYTLDVISNVDPSADIGRFDLLILMRACMPDALALVKSANEQGVPVIYAIDDDFEALDRSTPLGRHYHETRAWPRLLEICARASQVWAFSEPLRAKIAHVQPCIVVPPALASLELITRLREERPSAPVGPQRIGYGASNYHADDVSAISGALIRLLDELPDLQIDFIDVKPAGLVGRKRVFWYPKVNSVNEYYELALSRNWTVGIAPLGRNPANDAKTDNKYREYAAMGVPGVYADAPPYWGSVINGFNGIIAGDEQEWYLAIRALLTDREFAEGIVCRARGDVTARYGIDKVSRLYLELMHSAVARPIHVLVYAADIPTTDIDITRPFNRLKSEGRIDWRLIPYKSIANSVDLAWADILVVSRVHDQPALEVIERAKRENGLPVIFSWDDDFFSIPESLGALARHHRDPENVRCLETTLRAADLVKASTPLIEAKSLAHNPNVITAPYGFDFSQVRGSRAMRVGNGDEIVVGFFGTISHAGALEALLGALRIIARDNGNVRFEFFGPRTPLLESLPRTTFLPYAESAEESLRTLANRGWDIGVAPLERNDFNRAKLPTKYRDYSACHIAGVYSRVDPYEDVVTEEVTGLLVDNKEADWVRAINRLVRDASLRRAIASEAHAHVRNWFSLDQSVEVWRQILRRFADVLADPAEQADKQRKRMLALEAREAHLYYQVRVLREASNALLHAHLNPFPPAGSLLGRLRRYLFMKLRNLGTATPFASVSMPAPGEPVLALARIGALKGAEGDSIPLLGPNLQTMPFVEYPICERAFGGNRIRLATAALVPTLSGHIGIEIVTPGDKIHCHVLTPIEHMDPGQVAHFSIPEMRVDRAGWRIRCFARNSASPIHIYLRNIKGVGEPAQSLLLFSLEYESAERARTDEDGLITKQFVQTAGKVQKKHPRARAAKNPKIR